MKRLISLSLTVIMCLSLGMTAATAAESGRTQIGTISASLTANSALMDAVFIERKSCSDDSAESSLTLDVSPDKSAIDVALTINNTHYKATLPGQANEVAVNGLVGYIGVYEGFFINSAEKTSIDSVSVAEGIPVIVDVTFTDKEVFAALTIGYATEKTIPEIIFFGNLSDELGAISTEYTTKTLAAQEAKAMDEMVFPSNEGKSVDGETKLQANTTIKLGNYMAGALSLFHGDELRNQGSMPVYVKVNTNSISVENYVRYGLGYGSSTVTAYPGTFDLSVGGNHNSLHILTNAYLPQNASTSVTIPIPYYLPQIGFGTVGYHLTTSSTSASLSKYSPSSQHHNKVSWSMYRISGWSPSTFDGDYTTGTGMTGEATYTYSGHVTSDVPRTMTATGKINYRYACMVFDQLVTFNLPTGTMTRSSSVIIKP